MIDAKTAKDLKILDCTLRDGGYYNQWDFSDDLVKQYIQAMADTGIDYVEIGFRFARKEGFLGAYAYSTDRWIKSLPGIDRIRVGVMCNAKDLIKDGDPHAAVDRMFNPASETPVELVRIAAHFKEVEQCGEAVDALHKLGYKVGFNLMQSGGRTSEEIAEKARHIAAWPLDVLYFADSLGNMKPDDVQRTVDALRMGWDRDLGFHSHDNMGNALVNSLAAIKAGVSWVDGTVLGMGRGAGNVRTEYLLLELAQREIRPVEIDSLLQLVVGTFTPLQEKYRWGASIFYHLSALYGVHPTYVQEMLSNDRYSHEQVISALKRLGEEGASGYSESKLLGAVQDKVRSVDGTWVATGWAKDCDVLLIGPGERGGDHLSGLLQYLSDSQPIVLCLNSNSWFPSNEIGSWVACNPNRLLLDRDYYASHKGQLIAPASVIPSDVQASLSEFELLDYGLHIEEGEMTVESTSATLPEALAFLYALAVSEAAGAKRVYLAGFDGYSSGDQRNVKVSEYLQEYLARETAPEVRAITPTKLPVPQDSVYALDL